MVDLRNLGATLNISRYIIWIYEYITIPNFLMRDETPSGSQQNAESRFIIESASAGSRSHTAISERCLVTCLAGYV